MQAAIATDEGALEELVRRYHGAMLRHAVILLRNRDLAEEAVQETWAAVVAGLATFEGRSTLKTWIFRILTNRAKTRLIRGKRLVSLSPLTQSETGELALELPQNSTPEKLLLQKETMGHLQRALDRLTPNQRAVVNLRLVEGVEREEVSRRLRITGTNQRVLLHRARSGLQRALRNHLSFSHPRYSTRPRPVDTVG
jgi:RNA polymerase sigma-70 factor (ECF subfamily)